MLRLCLPFARVFKCSADIFPRGMFSEHVFPPKGKRILVSGGQHKIRARLIYLLFLNESEALLMPWRLARIEINIFRMSTWHFAPWCLQTYKNENFLKLFQLRFFFMLFFFYKLSLDIRARWIYDESRYFAFSLKHTKWLDINQSIKINECVSLYFGNIVFHDLMKNSSMNLSRLKASALKLQGHV